VVLNAWGVYKHEVFYSEVFKLSNVINEAKATTKILGELYLESQQ